MDEILSYIRLRTIDSTYAGAIWGAGLRRHQSLPGLDLKCQQTPPGHCPGPARPTQTPRFSRFWKSRHVQRCSGRTACHEHLRPPADRALARSRLPRLGRQRQGIPGCTRRHRGQHPGPCPPQAGSGAAGADRQADPHQQLLLHAQRREAGCHAVRALGAGQGVLLLQRSGGQRSRAQAGAQVRP